METPKCRVVHCKKEKFDVYIGRPSIWGNPYIVDVDGDRESCVQKYKEYLQRTKTLLALLPSLRGKILGCWCHPRPCHGDVLKEFVDACID